MGAQLSQAHDIPALIAAKLLKPLGNPPQNGTKFFATADVLEASKDSHWPSTEPSLKPANSNDAYARF